MNENIRTEILERIDKLVSLVEQSIENGKRTGVKYREASNISKEFSNAGMIIMTDLLRIVPEQEDKKNEKRID